MSLVKKVKFILGISPLIFLLVTFSNSDAAIKRMNTLDGIKNKILKLEGELNGRNDQYIKELEKVRIIDSEIQDLSLDLEEGQQKLKENKFKLKKMVGAQILNNIKDGNSMEKVYQTQLMKKMLGSQLEKISEDLKENERKISDLNKLKDRLFEHNLLLEHLSSILMELEEKKSRMVKIYSKGIEDDESTTNQKKKRVIFKTNFGKIISPIEDYKKIKRENKGVAFVYHGIKPLLASKKGKVVHVGKLGTYGNIVIVDHGDDLRTVLLGDIKINVKKDDSVEAGDIIGRGLSNGEKKSQIYFEVRKNNKHLDISNLASKKI